MSKFLNLNNYYYLSIGPKVFRASLIEQLAVLVVIVVGVVVVLGVVVVVVIVFGVVVVADVHPESP